MSIFSLSMSPLTRQFYAGKVRVKDGYSESVGVRHDVTNDFYGCLIQLAESHGGTFTINQNGKPAFEVTVRADKGNAPAEAIEAWISVNDRLPELNIDEPETIANGFRSAAHKMSERCLVVVNGHVTESKLLLSADRPAVPIWTMLQSDKVTHWMYVPAAPSQGVKNNG